MGTLKGFWWALSHTRSGLIFLTAVVLYLLIRWWAVIDRKLKSRGGV